MLHIANITHQKGGNTKSRVMKCKTKISKNSVIHAREGYKVTSKLLNNGRSVEDLTKEDHSRLKGNVEAIMQKGSYSKNELLTEVGERIKKLQVGS